MSYQPHLHKENELYHARTFGSKNGISNTPGYRAKGKKAVGRFVGVDAQGHPIYDYSNRSPVKKATGAQYRTVQQKNADANMANTRRKEVSDYNSFGSRAKRAAASAGNWLSDRGRDASNAASRAGRFISKLAGRARTAIGNAWDGKAGAGSARDEANRYRSYEQRNIKAGNKNKALDYHKQAQSAQSAYDRSIVGRFNAARDWLGRRANDVGDAASRARTAIGNAWDGKAGRGSAKTQMQEYGRSGRGREAQEAKERYDRSIVGTAERLMNRAGSAVRGAGEAVASGARRAGKAVSDSYVRSGASNTIRTLRTKGPVQEAKNQLNAFGGREGQQAKGNRTNVQNSQRSAQERKQYVDQVTREWGNAQRKYDMLSDKINSAKNEKERMRAQENLDRFTRETYAPARTAYNNVVKNKRK